MKAKISLSFLICLMLLAIPSLPTYSQEAGGYVKKEKCAVCGKLKQNCPYKGNHPKPTPSKPTPTMGTLSITSTPSDAAVKIDGEYMGTTPLTLKNRKAGTYKVTFSAEGYETTTKSITISAGKTANCSATLKKLTLLKNTNAIDFKAKILCNGIDDKFENNRFKNGDDLYLSFQSPVNGYLAVYLEGEDGQVSCLLPYHNQKNGIYPINANHRYLFFDSGSAPVNEKAQVVEYKMTCNNKSELNQIYIIFSPNKFTKASDYAIQEGLPRQLPRKDFQAWLTMCRKRDNEMNVKKVEIIIE